MLHFLTKMYPNDGNDVKLQQVAELNLVVFFFLHESKQTTLFLSVTLFKTSYFEKN